MANPMRLPSAALSLSLALGFAAPAALLSAAPPAIAQAPRDAAAEAFVQAQTGQALTILNSSQPLDAKKLAFRSFVDQVADVPKITGFVLGKYNRTVTPAQRQAFAEVFRLYANNVYESRLGKYKGEALKVTSSTVRAPGDVVVASQVAGGQLKQPSVVNWRVLKSADGRWRVVDVQVEGVWLAIVQQQDFVSTIDNAGGNVDTLISQLKERVATQAKTTS
jgi:phospholipid transport system substrate-binding protein